MPPLVLAAAGVLRAIIVVLSKQPAAIRATALVIQGPVVAAGL